MRTILLIAAVAIVCQTAAAQQPRPLAACANFASRPGRATRPRRARTASRADGAARTDAAQPPPKRPSLRKSGGQSGATGSDEAKARSIAAKYGVFLVGDSARRAQRQFAEQLAKTDLRRTSGCTTS